MRSSGNSINVLYQFDNKYAPYAGISITSLIENNSGAAITVYCAASKIIPKNINKINSLIKGSGNQVIWLDTSEAEKSIKKLGCDSWNNSFATWLKVFILEQIPESVERLLYIDCDTLVLGEIEELFGYDISNKAVGAVMDCLAQFECGRLNITEYYNAGVTLYNLKHMREHGMIKGMIKHLEKHVGQYRVNDQDLLNDYFHGNIYMLPLKYNVQGFLYMYEAKNYRSVYKAEQYYSVEEIEDAKKHPAIMHFFRILGDYPWEKQNMHACSADFHEWLNRSLWADVKDLEKKRSIIFSIEKFLYKLLPQKIFLCLFRLSVER